MSVIDELPLAVSGERQKGYDPVRIRRKKLAAALQDQLNLLHAEEAGQDFRRVKVERRRDLETDELFDVELKRRIVPWWWVDDEGAIKFTLRYGSARLKVKAGKDVLVLPTLDRLAEIIPLLRQETLAGGFDEALAEAAGELQARFKPQKPRK